MLPYYLFKLATIPFSPSLISIESLFFPFFVQAAPFQVFPEGKAMTTTHQIPYELGANLNMAHLETVNLARIVTGDSQERQKLYDAATRPGAFFLDLKSSDEAILDALPRLYALSDCYFQRPHAEKLSDFREDQPASSDRG